jgi:hypothetical protein
MKNWLSIAVLLLCHAADAQNEFAATAFYNEFNKIYIDAQDAFLENKGSVKKSLFEELAVEYRVKLLLPLADSGKIVFPVNGARPYVVYFFEPSKSRIKIDQRGLNLREAILTAFKNPLFTRTETLIQENKAYSSTYYFTMADEENKKMALFKSSIYPQDGLYYLSFEIRGKMP